MGGSVVGITTSGVLAAFSLQNFSATTCALVRQTVPLTTPLELRALLPSACIHL